MDPWKFNIKAGCSEVRVGDLCIGRVKRESKEVWFAESLEGERLSINGRVIKERTRREAARYLYARHLQCGGDPGNF